MEPTPENAGWLQTLLGLLPVVAAAFSPLITAAVKKALSLIGGQVPATILPVVNAVIGAVVAGVTGGDPTQGVVGAQVGKSVRDQVAARQSPL